MTSRLLSGLLVALALLALSAVTVLGHAELVTSDPPDGGTLETTPYTMTLTYDEPLDAQASSVIVRDSSGAEVASGGLTDESDTIMIVELPELPAGEYTVRWTAVTPDDNGVERGTLTFNVAEATATSPPATAAPATDRPATAAPVTAAPITPAPTATPLPVEPTTPGSNNDLLIALIVAGVALAGVLSYLYLRNRR